MTSLKKCQFTKLSDKHHYFSDGTVSFPFGYPFFDEIRKFKKESKENMQELISGKKLKC